MPTKPGKVLNFNCKKEFFLYIWIITQNKDISKTQQMLSRTLLKAQQISKQIKKKNFFFTKPEMFS